MKKKLVVGRSLRVKLLVSYMLFFTIPLFLMGGVSYSWLTNVVRAQVETSYTNSLLSIRETIDQEFYNITNIAVQLSETKWVKKLMIRELDISEIGLPLLLEYDQELLVYNAANNFTNNIAIYFHDKDLVLSSLGKSKPEYFFTKSIKVESITYSMWKDMTQKHLSNVIISNQSISINGGIRKGILYLQSLPATDNTYTRATFIAFVNSDVFDNLIDKILPNPNITFYICDKDNVLITGKNINSGELSFKSDINLTDNGKTIVKDINIIGGRSLLIHTESKRNGWSYTLLVPYAIFMKDVRKVQLIISVLIIFATMIGSFLSYVLAKRNYKPMSRIMELLEDKTRSSAVNNSEFIYDEFYLIENSIHHIIEQEKKLKEKIELNRPMLTDAYLNKLLSANTYNRDEILKMLNLLGISFAYSYYICFALLIIPYYNKIDNDNPQKKASLLITQLAYSNNIPLYYTSVGLYEVGICNYSNEEVFEQFLTGLRKLLDEEKFDITIGVGKPYTDINDLPVSLNEALVALDYRIIKEGEKIIVYEEIFNDNWYYYYPIDKEYRIVNCLKSGDFDGGAKIFREVMDINIKHKDLNINTIKCFFINAELTALKVAAELDMCESLNIEYNKLQICTTIKDMAACVEEKYHQICCYINNVIEEEESRYICKMKEEIIQYIDENLTESSLSLSVVSDRFNISPSYLSKFFKEQFDCNFLDHVNQKRINFAKEILEEQQTDINTVFQLAGYNNAVTFRRLFKKYEGITPSQYRDNGYRYM